MIYTPKTEGLNHIENDTPSDVTDLYCGHVLIMVLQV